MKKLSSKEKAFLIIGVFVGAFLGGWCMYGLIHKDDKGIEMIDGHHAVDLGLSVKWAALNVGADSLDDYGKLASYEEAQRLSWEGSWRFPTIEEWNELFDKCDVQRGLNGSVLTGPNGLHLFVPCDSLSNYAYWSSSPAKIGLVSHEKIGDTDTSAIKALSCFMMTDLAILQGMPVPEEAPNIATRLVCD